MPENQKSTGSTSTGPNFATLDAWEPIVGWIRTKTVETSVSQRKIIIAGTFVAIAIVSVLFSLISVPEYVHAIVGIPLGALLFCIAIGGAHLYYLKHPDKQTLRAKYPPMVRIKTGLGMFATLGIILLVISSRVPYILGGIIAVASFLCIYEFMRRNREEIILNESGQLDPRDEAILRKREEEEASKDNEKLLELLKDMTPEQKALVLQGKVSDALVVESDKKRGILGRKK